MRQTAYRAKLLTAALLFLAFGAIGVALLLVGCAHRQRAMLLCDPARPCRITQR